MPSFSAKPHSRTKRRRRVLHVLPEEATLLDVAGPLQVFQRARYGNGLAAYESVLLSSEGGWVATDTGVEIETRALSSVRVGEHDIVLVSGGHGIFEAEDDETLLAWLRRATKRARIVGSTCTGAFALAAAGILDGRRAVTHWDDCADLQKRYPSILVEEDPIFIRDASFCTSAGVTAGIDLALSIVEEDLGRSQAMDIARRLVVQSKRSGGQSQFSKRLQQQVSDKSERFEALHEWMMDNLCEDLRVEALAERMMMSTRSFYRSYVRATGLTPARAVARIRVEVARKHLEDSELSLGNIARQCGFGSEERMRKTFHRELGVAPSAYRRTWKTGNRA